MSRGHMIRSLGYPRPNQAGRQMGGVQPREPSELAVD